MPDHYEVELHTFNGNVQEFTVDVEASVIFIRNSGAATMTIENGGTDTTNTVKWEFTYTFAKGFGQEAFDTTGTAVTAEQASDGQYKHMITETDGVDIPTLTEPDGFIIVIVKRITNGATDTANDIFGISSDIHIKSTGLPTKNKAPNFYS